ncbi:membrane protein insertase YidC [Candidatus Profftella armatura]|uniref:Membrane protein insertase YidC n=1 Tax=Candidatus Profftella armatura TaxID=669502 RepID=S5R8R6_9PROT|nr:membrane protein insertase YidC [Candidatus Profftella armatura]AGS06995.1 preprotein translocase YidC subunit [Candidatus Profftella armatura]ALC96058.1 insertase [Candidatus Profftella armatura]QLK13891.1 membrane protein insertase YidC [Candidatus Profftella armatura]
MDVKRIILWIIFFFSLLMIFNSLINFNNHKSFFFSDIIKKTSLLNKYDIEKSSIINYKKHICSEEKNIKKNCINVKRKIITITTDIIKADIDTIGGTLKKLELLKYKDSNNSINNLKLFNCESNNTYLAKSGLLNKEFPNSNSKFIALPGKRTLGNNDFVKLILESKKNDIKLTKTYIFRRGDYKIDIIHTITNYSNKSIIPLLQMELIRDGNKPNGESYFCRTFTGLASYNNTDKFKKISFKDIEKSKRIYLNQSNNGWIAIIQHYFVSAIIPINGIKREAFIKKLSNNLYKIDYILPINKISPNSKVDIKSYLYSGPQISTMLSKTDPNLDLVKDYGWLTIFAKPIFKLMVYIHAFLDNWGWSIIFLTILIKLIFFPLSAISYKNMLKMKLLSPKIQEIRDRNKKNIKKTNEEIVNLYKKEKINPFSSILPIIIQIPVFISLYSVLLNSIEIRNAPWLGWIHDLSSPDKFYILPIFMMISTIIQNQLNSQSLDPEQNIISKFAPIIFSIVFFFFPSGLVLYWLINNILTIIQQWIINRSLI